MKIECIKGDGTRPPAPYESAATAINEMLAVKYRKSDGTNDYASTYNALGAFSGFGIQMAIRETLVNPGKMPEDKAFVVVKARDGKSYYFGDLLNGGLFGTPVSKISVWSLIGAAAHTCWGQTVAGYPRNGVPYCEGAGHKGFWNSQSSEGISTSGNALRIVAIRLEGNAGATGQVLCRAAVLGMDVRSGSAVSHSSYQGRIRSSGCRNHCDGSSNLHVES